MKKDIHPQYYQNGKIICACGNEIKVGSTVEAIQVELCSHCHPFYTGKQKLVDSARRVDKFKKRREKAVKLTGASTSKKVKRAKRDTKRTAKAKNLLENTDNK